MLKQIRDGNRQIVVRVHQTGALGHNAVAVKVGVIAKGNVKVIFQPDQTGHRIGRGAIHADLAVFIHGHKGEGRIHTRIDNFNV